jgi:DNA-binding beta-propeller fold protein YncE
MFFSVEHDNAVVVFRKDAKDEERPIGLIQGDRTGLADPHGIALDTSRGLIFVANHGSTHRVRADLGPLPEIPNWPLTRGYAVPGSGTLEPPSITVYARTARGDAAPVRVVTGAATQLNWPAQMFFDHGRNELFVANDGGHSVLVFSGDASGNAAPIRVIKGARTGLANPTGVWVDTVHDEVVVSNMGNHSATVYARTAAGDVAPLRSIKAAPAGKTALAIGNPGAVAYDSTRDQLLVPN